MELGVGTLFSTSVGSVSGPGVGDVLDDSRHGALREDSKPWAAVKRTMRQRRTNVKSVGTCGTIAERGNGPKMR